MRKYTDDEIYALKCCSREVNEAERQMDLFEKHAKDEDDNNGYMTSQFRYCSMMNVVNQLIAMCEELDFDLEKAIKVIQMMLKGSLRDVNKAMALVFDQRFADQIFCGWEWGMENCQFRND